MKVKMMICAVAAMMGSLLFAQDGKVVFKEDFEKAKANSTGKLYIQGWYSPSKIKENQEFSITRDKLNVKTGKFSGKFVNLNEKHQLYMFHEYSTIKLDDKSKKMVVTANVKGTGSVLIAFAFYKNNKFLRSAGISPIAGKQALPTKQKPFDDADWTTCYGQRTIPADATTCKMSIFVDPKSEIYLDDIEVKFVNK